MTRHTNTTKMERNLDAIAMGMSQSKSSFKLFLELNELNSTTVHRHLETTGESSTQRRSIGLYGVEQGKTNNKYV
jgi:hypothetical protein